MVLNKQIDRLAYYLLIGLILVNYNSYALALPNNNRVNVRYSQTEINTLEEIVKQRATALGQEDWETLLRLTSIAGRLEAFDGLFMLATFRGFDESYKQDTELLQAKINELKRTTRISNREEIVNASFAVQAAYYKALYDSLKEIFPQLKSRNIVIVGNRSKVSRRVILLPA